MNREYNCKVPSKNSKQLLKNLQNTTWDYFFAASFINRSRVVWTSKLSQLQMEHQNEYRYTGCSVNCQLQYHNCCFLNRIARL